MLTPTIFKTVIANETLTNSLKAGYDPAKAGYIAEYLFSEEDFIADDFEFVESGVIDLSENPKKRTFTIENKRLSALRFTDSGAGPYKVSIRSWGRITN